MKPQGTTIEVWCEGVGINVNTLRRWINREMIKVVNILGRNYITAEEDARFWERAKRGEFGQESNIAAYHEASSAH